MIHRLLLGKQCNTTIMIWILNSLSISIAQSVLWMNTAKDIWLNLKARYSQGDAFRFSDLMEEFYALKQSSLDVNQYFTNLKIVWDEIEVLKPTPNYSCEPVCNPNCVTLKAIQNNIATYVIKFLKELNDSLGQVMSQILMMKPCQQLMMLFNGAAI